MRSEIRASGVVSATTGVKGQLSSLNGMWWRRMKGEKRVGESEGEAATKVVVEEKERGDAREAELAP